MSTRFSASWIALCFGCFLPLVTSAADIRLSEHSNNNDPAVARLASGEAFFVWDQLGIVGRRYDATGQPLEAEEFPISVPQVGPDGKPDIAMNASGQAVVVWQGRDDNGTDLDILGRLYTFQGAGPSAPFKINLFDADDQFLPKVVIDDDGDFVVVYKSFGFDGDDTGIVMRRFDATGQPLDNEQGVNPSTVGSQIEPSLARGPAGELAVTWIDDANGANRRLLLRLFDAAGSPTSDAVEVADGAIFNGIAIASDGTILVVWNGPRIHGRRFDLNGMPLGDAFLIDEPSLSVGEPSVAALENGDFQVIWEQELDNPIGIDLFGRVVASDGTLKTAPSVVTATRPGPQQRADLTTQGFDFLVVFTSPHFGSAGVFSTCFTAEGCQEIFTDGFESGNVLEWDRREP